MVLQRSNLQSSSLDTAATVIQLLPLSFTTKTQGSPSLSYCSTMRSKHVRELMNGPLIAALICRHLLTSEMCSSLFCCILHDLSRYMCTQPSTQSTDLHPAISL